MDLARREVEEMEPFENLVVKMKDGKDRCEVMRSIYVI